MRLPAMNKPLLAFDAHNNTFKQFGDLTSIANTQGLSLYRLSYNYFAEVSMHIILI